MLKRILEEISNADDPRIAPFRDIRERDLVRRGGFIAEGTVVLKSLLRSPLYRPASLLVLRNRVSGIADLLDAVPPDVPVHVADGPVLDRIAGFAVHRGVLAHGVPAAIGRDPLPERLGRIAAAAGVVVAAVGIANHDNMGGIFRNAAAFAAGMVLLDETSCDPLYRKAIRVSAGSVLQVPFERVDPFATLNVLRASGFRAFALSPRGDGDIRALAGNGPVAIFLGSEGAGLPEELMAGMPGMRIDMAPGFDSLNVATSAAIVLQRLYSRRRGVRSG